ncbi:hypothetical protein QQS21_003157 [Conoideocrella luteorostrata]|uniref:Uncharacterized protein n=1 Tax=Conoideocrella luteorostrata TaxID=1105319 RepID=A0AAJ0CTU4_9HYPO|nr:hypothetical protein QQS21_003157 [Conoideocrella luteorostrata]
MCQQAGLSCPGYAPQLLWASDVSGHYLEESGNDVAKRRFPLLSGRSQVTTIRSQGSSSGAEKERESMSGVLDKSIDSQAAEDVLISLDAAIRRVRNNEDFDVCIGPFGAFQIAKTRNRPKYIDSSSSTVISNQGDKFNAMVDSYADTTQSDEWIFELDQVDLGALDMSMEINMDHVVNQSSDQAAQQLSGVDTSLELYLNTLPCTEIRTEPRVGGECPPASEGIRYEGDNEYEDGTSNTLLLASSPTQSSAKCGLLEGAPTLLRYYKKHIDAMTAAIKARRTSPWQLVFLPCAFQIFAELTLLGTASNVRKAILYAVLSKSALHFHRTQADQKNSDHWRDVGTQHETSARYYLDMALKLDMVEFEETEYEHLLMALLIMALTSIFRDGKGPRYLLDAERLMRFQGHHGPRALHTRILHHVYTYLRVIAESIPAVEQQSCDGAVVQGDHFKSRTFRIGQGALNVGLDPDYEKTAEIGYGDFHLEIQGRWPETLHYTIHGVPESLMTLLAQTTSLANEIAHLEQRIDHDTNLSRELKRHTKTLEKRVWSWCLDVELRLTSSQQGNQANVSLIEHPQTQFMIGALHQALVVYFYRRVYDVSPRLLQDNILKALAHLEACLEHLAADEDFTPSLAWAAFITASEAVSAEVRARALKCVDIIDEIGFHFTSGKSKDAIISTWENQKSLGTV